MNPGLGSTMTHNNCYDYLLIKPLMTVKQTKSYTSRQTWTLLLVLFYCFKFLVRTVLEKVQTVALMILSSALSIIFVCELQGPIPYFWRNKFIIHFYDNQECMQLLRDDTNTSTIHIFLPISGIILPPALPCRIISLQ